MKKFFITGAIATVYSLGHPGKTNEAITGAKDSKGYKSTVRKILKNL